MASEHEDTTATVMSTMMEDHRELKALHGQTVEVDAGSKEDALSTLEWFAAQLTDDCLNKSNSNALAAIFFCEDEPQTDWVVPSCAEMCRF